MSDLFDALALLFRLIWGLLRLLWGLLTAIGAIWDWIDIFDRPFRRSDPGDKAKRARLNRVREAREVRIASHLGTDLEYPHISHMTPPPSRQDGDDR